MNTGLESAFAPPAERTAPAPPGLWSLCIDIVRRPSAAMRALAARPGRRWVWPLLALAILGAATAFAVARQSADQAMAEARAAMAQAEAESGAAPAISEGALAAGMRIGMAMAVVGGMVAPFLGAALAAAILHFLATVMGGQQGFVEMLTVVSWSRVPLVIGGALRLAHGLVAGFDPSPRGLAGFVEGSHFAGPLLAQVELWNLWMLVLLFLGVRAVARLSRGKALAAVGLLLGLWLLAGEAGVLTARFMGRF